MSEQWYTNKDLFELINGMQGDFNSLRSEMKETRSMIKQYNGLREELGNARIEIEEVKQELDAIVSEKKGKVLVFKSIRDWGGWIFGLITLLVLLYTTLI